MADRMELYCRQLTIENSTNTMIRAKRNYPRIDVP